MIKAMERASTTSGEIMQTCDVAKELDLTPDGVRRLVDVGQLRAIRTLSGQRLFRREDVEALKAERAARADARAHERMRRVG